MKDLLIGTFDGVDRHEFLAFEEPLKNAVIIGVLKNYFKNLLDRTKLKLERGDSNLRLELKLTVNGNETVTETESEKLIEVLDKLSTYKTLTFDWYTYGGCGTFIASEEYDDDGINDSDYSRSGQPPIDGGASLMTFLDLMKEKADFIYKNITNFYLDGSFFFGKIAHGKVINIKNQLTRDIIKEDDYTPWDSDEIVMVLDSADNLKKEELEKLYAVVRKHAPEKEVSRACEENWEDEEEKDVIVGGIVWSVDKLQRIEDFLTELNGVLKEVNASVYDGHKTFEVYNLWHNFDKFGIAKYKRFEDGLHMVGTML